MPVRFEMKTEWSASFPPNAQEVKYGLMLLDPSPVSRRTRPPVFGSVDSFFAGESSDVDTGVRRMFAPELSGRDDHNHLPLFRTFYTRRQATIRNDVAIVRLRIESRTRSSPSAELGTSLPRRLTREKHSSDIHLSLVPGFPFGKIADNVFPMRAFDLIRQRPADACDLLSPGID